METQIFTLLLIAFAFVSKAQTPDWSMPVILVVPGYGSDTTWIGMDANGAVGYQPGLDSLADTYTAPFGIFGVDSTLTLNNCFNLKRNIKNFINPGVQTFDFYIRLDETIPPFGSLQKPYLDFDNSKLNYTSNGNNLTKFFIFSNYGYINGIDVNQWTISASTDSISLIFEPSNLNFYCNTNDYVMMARIIVMNNIFVYNEDLYNLNSISILPTINNGRFKLQHSFSIIRWDQLKIFNTFGLEIPYVIDNTNQIHVLSPISGIYVLALQFNNKLVTKKFIIN